MIRIQDILDKVAEYFPEADLDLINRAYVYSAQVHAGQVRLSGEPYLSHPLEVAGILADMHLDVLSISAGLLHDVVEDTHASNEEITSMFGPQLARLVAGVTKISALSFKTREERQAESIRKMILAMADDLRVVLIKLADRLHNMRTIEFHTPDRQRAIARETMDIYAPIASRLGIYWIKKELEDHAFKVLFPDEYKEIDHLLAQSAKEKDEYIRTVRKLLEEKLASAGLSGEITGRFKHHYSVWNKMQRQNLAFEDIYDVIAFRAILGTVSQCYEALGLVHAMWRPIPGKFKDYIGNPKPNMYQSLHTTVIGPYGRRVEIQIRTREMDEVAKWGIAAHWSYKEGRQADERTRRAFAWIQNIVENQESVRDPEEFLKNVRIELFPDEVYVFTPQGDVISLPRGASPVDFAYAIHSEVGNRCAGAKVNGRMVPLKTPLHTGDSVEIITSKNRRPSKDWLSFVKTVKARSRIRQWIKTEERERSLALGREMVEKTFRRHRMSVNALLKSDDLQRVLDELGYKTADDLLAAVGYGKITPLQVQRKLLPKGEPEEEKKADEDQEEAASAPAAPPPPEGVTVRGLDDILVKFAKCCDPVPGDPIIGYITRGQGVTVHRKTCSNVLALDEARAIEVEWGEGGTQTYPVKLHVEAGDRKGLLADLTRAISLCDANILASSTRMVDDSQIAEAFFTVQVSGKNELEKVLRAIRKVPDVHKVRRVSG
ncbi:MAG: bifunctional (p)ppGpp synthetase/guanosine-3',5'-bis(diphosphate) 3'-pyrophosphohydrolase [Deltaproteobacteria bacterium]|nr:bifunctional (p)ppGpp synthetase/guanosine-3',5'-bis(diphosphate) 3'-pyrophosphohydrolase [Deltaproteobacteria bacterium]